MESLTAKLEALLFAYGDLLSVKKAAEVLGVSAAEVTNAGEQLKQQLEARGSGLTIMVHEEALQIVTRPEHAQLLQLVLKAELNESLTPAALETLAIITYAAPVSRAEIDYIRGVNASYTVRALALRGLIEREADPKRANVYLYKPSAELIRHLGVSRVEELPDYEPFRSLAATIKTPTTSAPTEAPAAQNPETKVG